MFQFYIVQQARLRNNSKSLTDSIYSNVTTLNNISNNLSATASDIFTNLTFTKSNIFVRDWSNFDQEKYILGYLSVDLDNLNKTNNGNIDESFVIFLTKFSLILDIQSPFF